MAVTVLLTLFALECASAGAYVAHGRRDDHRRDGEHRAVVATFGSLLLAGLGLLLLAGASRW